LQNFVSSILSKDANASVVLAGDMNEYLQTRSVFRALDGLVYDINELSGVPPTERYTYVYEQHTQEIDHMFVSEAVARRGTEVEHVHVNTWAPSVSERASDHDPTVARVRVCDRAAGVEGESWLILFRFLVFWH
jgi:predicted extracellular nuclease